MRTPCVESVRSLPSGAHEVKDDSPERTFDPKIEASVPDEGSAQGDNSITLSPTQHRAALPSTRRPSQDMPSRMAHRILAVIPTFNRGELIALTSAYLQRIPFDPAAFRFLISDDCSTDYGLEFLRGAYSRLPNASFMRTSRNAGAAAHLWVLLKHFASGSWEKILILDSDLVVHERCLDCIEAFEDAPIASLYNSRLHPIEHNYDGYCTKSDIGWAGALIGRRVIEELLQAHGNEPFDDWALRDYSLSRQVPIKVCTPSVIEHIGITGANNVGPDYFDRSCDFPRETIDQATRDYFRHVRGIDLLHYLAEGPEPMPDAEDLRVFRLPTSMESKRS
jgi:hypothetical protein